MKGGTCQILARKNFELHTSQVFWGLYSLYFYKKLMHLNVHTAGPIQQSGIIEYPYCWLGKAELFMARYPPPKERPWELWTVLFFLSLLCNEKFIRTILSFLGRLHFKPSDRFRPFLSEMFEIMFRLSGSIEHPSIWLSILTCSSQREDRSV